MKCRVCEKNEATATIPYTVTLKEDAYSDTIKEILQKGTRITVHLPMCKDCISNGEKVEEAIS